MGVGEHLDQLRVTNRELEQQTIKIDLATFVPSFLERKFELVAD